MKTTCLRQNGMHWTIGGCWMCGSGIAAVACGNGRNGPQRRWLPEMLFTHWNRKVNVSGHWYRSSSHGDVFLGHINLWTCLFYDYFLFRFFFFVAFFQCEQWDCFLCASVYGGARLKWWVNEWTKKAEMLDVDNDAWPVKIFMFGSFGVYEPFCSLECIAFIYSL